MIICVLVLYAFYDDYFICFCIKNEYSWLLLTIYQNHSGVVVSPGFWSFRCISLSFMFIMSM